MSVTVYPADLDGCAQEPIHTPGSIQPHGMMLIADAGSLMVSHVAGDVEGRLGVADWAGQTLSRFIGDKLAAEAGALAGAGAASFYAGQCATPGGETLDVAVHMSGAHLIVELEPASAEGLSAAQVMNRVTAASATLARAASLASVCDRAAVEFRRLTGFDRVLVYRFNEDGAGEVLSEDRRSGMHSFLNHRFPQSDIPAQARALYVRNVLRVIPDATYEPVALRPAWTEQMPLDMTDSSLRSVSPIHLQYLRNMGVRASASFSIVIDERLWGLIACHNETARLLTYDLRSACRAVVDNLSRKIKAKEEADGLRQRIRLRGFEDGMVAVLSRSGMLAGDLSNHLDEICRMMDGDGVAIVRGSDIVCSGACPPHADIAKLATWLAARSIEVVFSTERLCDLYPAGAAFARTGSGVLSLTLSPDQPWLVIWFRAEQVETVNWAGNPHKAAPAGEGGMLTPRTSFESWAETVRGQSRCWTLAKLEAAIRLRAALLEVQQTWRTRELNLQLTRLLQDKDLLLQQKEFLVGEINHRVQNSLQLVGSFLSVQARASGNADVQDALSEARRRLNAVALVHRRLYRGDLVEMVDVARYIEELCADTVAFMGDEWAGHLRLDLSPALLPTDRAVALGLLLTELLINANKHAYGGAAGPLSVELGQTRTHLRLAVADRGSGTGAAAPETGFGSRIMAGLVKQLGGVITRSDNCPGMLVAVVIPTKPGATG